MNPLFRELRLGNYLETKEGYIRVTVIGENGMFQSEPFPVSGERNIGFPGEYQGIPLTDEIMEKCGLYVTNPGSLDIGSCKFLNDGGRWYLRDGSRYLSKFPIQYLHQFQNFYVFLRGEEIKFKP